VEIARFILIAVGTFLSVLSLSFTVFRHWRKKQDEKLDSFTAAVREMVAKEAECRKESFGYLKDRIGALEATDNTMAQRFENRLSVMEGELKGIKSILLSINQWFINGGGKQ